VRELAAQAFACTRADHQGRFVAAGHAPEDRIRQRAPPEVFARSIRDHRGRRTVSIFFPSLVRLVVGEEHVSTDLFPGWSRGGIYELRGYICLGAMLRQLGQDSGRWHA
jgi:hypothetical protein